MLINDLLGMLMEVPPVLAGQWAAWFAVGLILSIWGRREKTWVVAQPAATTRHNSGVHSPSLHPLPGVRTRPAPIAPPHSTGDAFAELEALLEQPTGVCIALRASLHSSPKRARGARNHAARRAAKPAVVSTGTVSIKQKGTDPFESVPLT